ncbi:hypothetical protein KW798_01685, partial [Candidatus Parcubacteria bacterium]|nr:hypothetical protein [Candidatus Parcubacteria bacterium]
GNLKRLHVHVFPCKTFVLPPNHMHKLRNILVISFLLLPTLAQAQLVPDPVQFIVAPEIPGPNEKTTIQVQGVGSFLGDATITWRENGKVMLTGAGERTYSFTTGALGTQTSVTVSINSQTQGLIEKSFLFRPSVVNLIWEADTTSPLFYRGKTFYTPGAQVKIVAFPTVIVSGTRVSNSSLSFQWSHNDDPLPVQSGLGRNILNIAGDELQTSENIALDVYLGGARVAHGTLEIPASNPALLLYSRDPLRGEMLDVSLPNAISLNSAEITIQAEPYFFSKSSVKAGLLQYTWELNNQEITGPESANGLLTLRQTGQGGGGATVGVSLQNNDPDGLVQTAETALQILFGSNSSSIFGL